MRRGKADAPDHFREPGNVTAGTVRDSGPLADCPMSYLRFFSCPNVQNFRRSLLTNTGPFDLTAFNSFHDFLFNLSCLQNLYIFVTQGLGRDSLIQFVFCGAVSEREYGEISGVWKWRSRLIPPQKHLTSSTRQLDTSGVMRNGGKHSQPRETHMTVGASI